MVPFLKALKRGHWIILDELNLASQSVLEGLNACLDHRGVIYIPELDREFKVNTQSTRIFATQNPVREGGGRKGLPRSFLSRFSVVWMEALNKQDYHTIADAVYPMIKQRHLMIEFVTTLVHKVNDQRIFGRQGSPWEFNLRDLFRWFELAKDHEDAVAHIPMLFVQRFRSLEDRMHIYELVKSIFRVELSRNTTYEIIHDKFTVGRHSFDTSNIRNHVVLSVHIPLIASLATCIQKNWLVILTGATASGKSHMLHFMSELHPAKLTTFSMHNEVDTLELLGSFEQVNVQRQIRFIIEDWNAVYDDKKAQTLLSWLDIDRTQEELEGIHCLNRSS